MMRFDNFLILFKEKVWDNSHRYLTLNGALLLAICLVALYFVELLPYVFFFFMVLRTSDAIANESTADYKNVVKLWGLFCTVNIFTTIARILCGYFSLFIVNLVVSIATVGIYYMMHYGACKDMSCDILKTLFEKNKPVLAKVDELGDQMLAQVDELIKRVFHPKETQAPDSTSDAVAQEPSAPEPSAPEPTDPKAPTQSRSPTAETKNVKNESPTGSPTGSPTAKAESESESDRALDVSVD